jgi:hypothetical protein
VKRAFRALAVAVTATLTFAAVALAVDVKVDVSAADGQQNQIDAGETLIGGSLLLFDAKLYSNSFGDGDNFYTAIGFQLDAKPTFVGSVGSGVVTSANTSFSTGVASTIEVNVPCQLGAFGGPIAGLVTYKLNPATTVGGGVDPVDFTTAYAVITGSVSSLGPACSPAYTITGFYNPVENRQDDAGAVNGANAGSAVPLKFNIWDGTTAISDTNEVSALVQETPCASGADVDMLTNAELSSGSTSLRWDGTQFIFNWKTDKSWAGSCYRVTATASGGASLSADFQLNK